MGHHYDESAIVIADGTPAPLDDASEYVQTSRPGHRAPHAWLADGRSTLDLFGDGFTLLRLGEDPPDPAGFVSAASRVGLPLSVIWVDQADVAELYERRLVLVRPDGMVAWRGDDAPADPSAVINTVRGALVVSAASGHPAP
jgi:hypothetical protein